MNLKKTTLAAAVGLVMGGTASFSANAALTSSATMTFTLGTVATSCLLGTTPPCTNTLFNKTDIVGSWFAMDTNGNGVTNNEKFPIGSLNGIHIGGAQAAGGSHAGSINGTEAPNIDNPWTFFSNTGMHQTTSAITVLTDMGSVKILDMSGWNVAWNTLTSIPLVATSDFVVTCDQSSCSNSSNYTGTGTFHVNGAGFTTVAYTLYLEGHVASAAVPVPAAAWLFGSGLLGLAGVARRRKNK